MAQVIQFPKQNVKSMTTDALKDAWDKWDGDTETMFHPIDMEDVHKELNRRGEGNYCAV